MLQKTERVSETIGREKFQAGRTKGSLQLDLIHGIIDLFQVLLLFQRKDFFTVKAHVHESY